MENNIDNKIDNIKTFLKKIDNKVKQILLNYFIVYRLIGWSYIIIISKKNYGVTNKKVIIYPFYSKINKWDKYDKLFTNMISQFLTYVV